MSTTTDKLALFKYDPSTDGAQTFNIKKALNDNWDKLDDAVKEILITLANKTNASAPAMYDVPMESGYKVPYGGFRYGKDQFGVVHLYGIFETTSGMVKGNNTIGTLPEGFRPTMQVHAAAFLTLNWVTDSVAQFYVASNGTLICTIGKDISSGNTVDIGVNVSFVSGL